MRLGPIVTAAVLAAALSACNQADTSKQAPPPPAAEPPPAPAATAEADKTALLASYPAPYNTADLGNGEAKFALCRSCHTIQPGGANMTGPNLHGVFGRKAAQVDKFKYSDALKTSGIVWDAAHLDEWLAKPQTYLPGTKMSFAGLKEPKDRVDLIAWLMTETGYKPQAGAAPGG
jgi:cytochrome c